MTDAELRDAGVAELKKTRQGYLKANGDPRALEGAQWKKGLALLEQIGAASPSPVGLKWPRPVLTSPSVFQVSNGNRLLDGGGRDWVIEWPSTPITAKGGLTIKNVGTCVSIGGEIRNDSLYQSGGIDQQYGIYLLGKIDLIHFEDLRIGGSAIGQGVVSSPNWSGGMYVPTTIQMQNCRIETLHPVGVIHTDGIQSAGGPRTMRLYNCTIRSMGLSLQMQPREHGYAGPLDDWHYERVNMEHLSAAAPALNKSNSGQAWWPEYHKDLWLKANQGHSQPIHVNWSYDPDGWDPSGGTSVTGEALHLGVPPGGDFCG